MASPLKGSFAVGRHFVPVAIEIILQSSKSDERVRKNDAAMVYWEAGGLKDMEEYN
jgi:hypothetical protein